MKKRARTSPLLKEWLEHAVISVGSGKTEPAKYMVVAKDRLTKEDYPLYAGTMSKVKDMQIQLGKTGQDLVEIITV